MNAPPSSETPASPQSSFARWAAVACIVLTIGVYAGGLTAPFVFDDAFAIAENPHLQNGVNPLWQMILSPDLSDSRQAAQAAHPVAFLSYAINFQIDGTRPLGFHAVNLAGHVLAALLVFLLSRRIFSGILGNPAVLPSAGKNRNPKPSRLDAFFGIPGRLAELAALFTALVFALHPLQSEAVYYASGRPEAFAALFSLAALFSFLKSADGCGEIWTAACCAGFVLAFGSSATAAALPLGLLLFDWAFLDGTRSRWKLHAALWTLLAALCVFFFQPGAPAAQPWTRWNYLATQAFSVLSYTGLFLLPVRQTVDHFLPPPRSLMDAHIFFSAAALAGLGLFVRHLYRQASAQTGKLILFAAGWFFVFLLPTSSFIPMSQALVERRASLSLWGLALGLVLFYAWMFDFPLNPDAKSSRAPKTGSFLAVLTLHLLALAAFTVWRGNLYRHPEELWMEAIRRSPDNPRAYYQIGRIFQDAGQLPAAAASYNKALELKPGYPEAAEAMAGIYAQTKSPEKAKELYQQAEKTGGESAELYFNRGVASYKNNDFAGAEAAYLKALELDPKFYKAYNNLAVVQIQAQRYDEAVESCRKSLEINPRYGVTHFNLGNAYLKMKDYPRAMAEFKTAQSLMPGDPGVQMRIAETERLLK